MGLCQVWRLIDHMLKYFYCFAIILLPQIGKSNIKNAFYTVGRQGMLRAVGLHCFFIFAQLTIDVPHKTKSLMALGIQGNRLFKALKRFCKPL